LIPLASHKRHSEEEKKRDRNDVVREEDLGNKQTNLCSYRERFPPQVLLQQIFITKMQKSLAEQFYSLKQISPPLNWI